MKRQVGLLGFIFLCVTDVVPAPDRSDARDQDILRRLDDSERNHDRKVWICSVYTVLYYTFVQTVQAATLIIIGCVFIVFFKSLTVESLAEISNYSRGTFIPT